jgi:hypothetical protein
MIALIASAAFACNVGALLSQVALATGGSAWKPVGEVAASGSLRSAGLHGTAQLREDVRSGRYTIRRTLPVAGTTIETYDGKTVWARDISGGVHPYDAWYPRARSITDSYINRRGYLERRGDASIACAGFGQDDAGRTELVRVLPRNGIPALIAIDARTHLVHSIAIRTPISTDVTTLDDYRQVGSIVLPFLISSASLFEPANGDRIAITRYTITSRVGANDFAKPSVAENARMLGAARATTVPIALERYQLFVWASVDGHAPMPFILDTGGHAILDTVAAHALGLRATGAGVSGGSGAGTIGLQFTRVASVRIGSAELVDQPFLVIPYPYSFYERGRRAPLAGILGLEWFERYAARIDYGGRTLTLTPLKSFSRRTQRAALPIRFQEDMPLASAAADGHDGPFGVDTGNGGILILYGDFLRRSGLLRKYAPGYVVHGEGTGGSNAGRIQTLSRFTIGGRTLPNLVADFTQMQTGEFSSWTEAGDVGLTVLSRFTPTFDYGGRRLYLEPAAHPWAIPKNRSGLGFTKNQPDAIEVVAVRPHSAASAAGILAGDRILAVNAKSARELSSADFADLVAAPAGTPLELTIRRGTATRVLRLVLQ